MAKLQVFKEQYALGLSQSIDKNINKYLDSDIAFFAGEEKNLLTSSIDISDEAPVLGVEINDEAENAIKVFEYLPINLSMASDPRLWVYMSHVTFFPYSKKRWKIESSDNGKTIADRFFIKGGNINARNLRRHAIARLWWAAYLTFSLWDKAELYFLKKDDEYYYTRVLMQSEDFASSILERPQLSASPVLLISILDYFDRHPEYTKRAIRRAFLKEIVLTLGYKKILMFDYINLMAEFDAISADICEYLQDENDNDKDEVAEEIE